MAPVLIGLIGSIIDKIIPDKGASDEAKLKLATLVQSGELAALEASTRLLSGQLEVNKAEASSGNAFASSWRPLIGYVCGASLAYNFIFYPMLMWIAAAYVPEMKVPPLLENNLMELVVGMLGLAGFRTFEKTKGVA